MIEHVDIRHNIQDLSFKSLIAAHVTEFIRLSQLLRDTPDKGILSRDFLGKYHIEAVKVEEYLDMHGAKNNKSWYSFRECAAAVKMFSHVLYILYHRSWSGHASSFRDIYETYDTETKRAAALFRSVLKTIARRLCILSENFEINPQYSFQCEVIQDDPETFQLEQNRKLKNIEDPEKIVVQLASQFLNYGKSDLINNFQNISDSREMAAFIPIVISEEKLRSLESKFHSLQSQYDTYISDTNLENLDSNVPVLRASITLIYQLLDIATNISHYYERHQRNSSPESNSYISQDEILKVLLNYCLHFIHQFVDAARQLCQEMIRAYAEQGEILVPIPPYRGFHVRPSTLIAKIVHHYGSEIALFMNSNKYDAANPLELFRANEEINAIKRKMLYEFISSIIGINQETTIDFEQFAHNLNKLILKLLEEKKIMLYDNEFSSRNVSPIESESFCEYAKRGIAKLLALGSIDIQIDMNVTLRGDKRVLKDIQTLADTGYGEDQYGNNIMLPKTLSYLRR
ncbi:MAG: hypothetical protein JW874_12675 [Spirochaetales bacterium]|nr:hypothetical protein [Spirochaetales bacterium]